MNSKLIVSLLAVITVVFLFLIFDWTMSSIIHRRKEVLVPSITGKSVADALDILSRYNLGLKKSGQEYHLDLPPGTVTRQDPPGGMIVRENKIVKVTISRGSELIFVPDVVDKTLRKTKLIIRRAQLDMGNIRKIYSLRFGKDKVISQTPGPNSIIDRNTEVDLVVSLGVPSDGTLLMPDFVGKSIHEAKIWCSENNIECEITEEHQSVPPGTVVRQEPVPDTVIVENAAVYMFVSVYGPSKIEYSSLGEPVHYEVPQGLKEQKIRMVVIDSEGEREVFSRTQSPGSKIDLTILKKGETKLRIFINNILVEEREL
jgi:serine/threonine-protein kinase